MELADATISSIAISMMLSAFVNTQSGLIPEADAIFGGGPLFPCHAQPRQFALAIVQAMKQILTFKFWSFGRINSLIL